MKRFHSLAVALLLGASALPCQAGQADDQRPELYKTALTLGQTILEVRDVDGVKPAWRKSKLRIEPGQHRLQGITGLLFDPDEKPYQGSFAFDFEAQAGQTYLLTLSPNATITDASQVCLHEEARDDPKRDIKGFGGLRYPGPNAALLKCVPLVMSPV